MHGRQGDCPRQPQALRPDDRRNQLLLRRRIALDPGQPLNGAIATSLKLTAIGGTAGVANEGFWGIPVRPAIDGLWTSFNPYGKQNCNSVNLEIQSAGTKPDEPRRRLVSP